MRALVIAFGMLLVAAPAFAGPNPGAALAMHTVASFEYLYCPELTVPGMYFPPDCLGIDPSATPDELVASYGYVYVVFLAYNVECITGVEFCVTGWPTTRGVPATPVLSYCPDGALVLGTPWQTGCISAFGQSVCSPLLCGGTVGFGYFFLNTNPIVTYLPMTLSYCMSQYSYTADPHNYVLGPPPDYVEDTTVSHHGCVIGGVSIEPFPFDDCNPQSTAVQPSTWSNVKAMYR